MTNAYYNPNGDPVFLAFGASAKIRNQFAAVGAGFDGVAAALAALAQPAQPLLPININPDFIFDQVNEGALYVVNTAEMHLMDGWLGGASGAGVFKTRRLADPDNAALKCMEITCTTADAAIGASDYYGIKTVVEGHDIAFAGFSTSQVKPLTLMFKFKTSVAGTYGIALTNSAFTRGFLSSISAVDTNEHDYTIPITPDISGAWLYTEGTGLRLHLTLAAGTAFHGAAGAWSNNGFLATSAQVNFMSSTSNIAYLKRVHLVPGSTVLPYAPADVGAQLRKCQRYFVKTFSQGTAVAQGPGSAATALTHSVAVAGVATQHLSWRFPVTMRSAPSMIAYNPGAAGTVWYNVLDGANSGASSFVAAGADSAIIAISQLAGDGVGDILVLHVIADARLT